MTLHAMFDQAHSLDIAHKHAESYNNISTTSAELENSLAASDMRSKKSKTCELQED